MSIDFKYEDYNLGVKPALYVKKTLKFLQNNRIKHILDFGCGGGRNSFFLNSNGFHVIGMDSKKVLDLYRKDFLRNKIEIKTFNIKTTKVPFKSNSFECILSWRVLHRGLKKYRYTLVKDLRRILKNNGFLIVAVSMDKDIKIDQKRRDQKEIENNTFEYFSKGIKNIRHYYSKREILSKKAFPGFKVVSLSSFKEKTGHKGEKYIKNYWKVILQKE